MWSFFFSPQTFLPLSNPNKGEMGGGVQPCNLLFPRCPYTLTQGQGTTYPPKDTLATQAGTPVKTRGQPQESLWKYTCFSSLSTNSLKRSDCFQNWESQASPFVPFYWHFWPCWKSMLCFAIKIIRERSLPSDILYYRTEHSKPLSSKKGSCPEELPDLGEPFSPLHRVHTVNGAATRVSNSVDGTPVWHFLDWVTPSLDAVLSKILKVNLKS